MNNFDYKKYLAEGKLTEAGFDDRLKAAMGKSGFSDDEQDSFFSKDTPSTAGIGGYQKARDLIDKLRSEYKSMSDEDLDEFSKEMTLHFMDNTAGQAASKVFFAKNQL
tara:strand:- start:52 stop:375 length:324 start_codon:yes stop_codon:yes gene_type:complete